MQGYEEVIVDGGYFKQELILKKGLIADNCETDVNGVKIIGFYQLQEILNTIQLKGWNCETEMFEGVN